MRRTSILTGGCLLGLSMMFGHILVRPTSGQGDAAPSRQTGRYQIGNGAQHTFVIDTATGHVWMWDYDDTWRDFGSPLEPKKK
jgi:hypothetical protein